MTVIVALDDLAGFPDQRSGLRHIFQRRRVL